MFGAPRSAWARMMQFVYQSHNLIQVAKTCTCIIFLPILKIYSSESTPLSFPCLAVIVHSSMVSPQS